MSGEAYLLSDKKQKVKQKQKIMRQRVRSENRSSCFHCSVKRTGC
jgi:hypothetical protein